MEDSAGGDAVEDKVGRGRSASGLGGTGQMMSGRGAASEQTSPDELVMMQGQQQHATLVDNEMTADDEDSNDDENKEEEEEEPRSADEHNEEDNNLDNTISGTISGSTTTSCSVRFGTLHIYEFPAALGDNPSVMGGGPPMRLGYEHVEKASQTSSSPSSAAAARPPSPPTPVVVNVLDYENTKKARRSGTELRVPPDLRRAWVVLHHTEQEVRQAVRDVRKAKHNRQMSIATQDYEHFNMMLDAVGKKIGKWLRRPEVQPGSAEYWNQRYKMQRMAEKELLKEKQRVKKRTNIDGSNSRPVKTAALPKQVSSTSKTFLQVDSEENVCC